VKVKDLVNYLADTVVVYKENNNEFSDIFKGNSKDFLKNILEMEVKNIGGKRKGVLDLQVK